MQGGTGPYAFESPGTGETITFILTSLEGSGAPGTLATAPAAAWLTAPDNFGRLNADMAILNLPYERAAPGATTVEIADLRGQVVRRFTAPPQPAGAYAFTWDGRSGAGKMLPAGFYFVRLDGHVTRIAKLGE